MVEPAPDGRRVGTLSRRALLRAGALALSSGLVSTLAGHDRAAAGQVAPGASILVRGGRLVTADRQWDADIRVRDGRITEVGRRLRAREGERAIDASGLQVLPGGIDPHAHLLPSWVDDYLSGSQAALAGGVTSIGCMASLQKGERVLDAIARQAALVRQQSLADIFLHPILGAPTAEVQAQLPALRAEGHSDIKIFMTSRTFAENQAAWTALIAEAGRLGLLTMLHCEDAELMAEAAAALTAAGRTSLRDYADSRPVSSEVRAVERAVAIAEVSRAPIYVVHLSSKGALDVCLSAKRRGLPVWVETRPIYLHFTRERYLQADGPLYVGQPPLREAEDVKALWQGLAEGGVDTLGTDHAPWTREQKMDPALSITRLRPGVADLQTMLPVFYSEGVVKRGLPLERFVALTSTNAARLFGLYPRKGTIAVGSDGDLVLWDPKARQTVTQAAGFSRAGFSLHDGWEVTGVPVMTIRRGDVVCEGGKVVAAPGSGRLLSCGPTQSLRPA